MKRYWILFTIVLFLTLFVAIKKGFLLGISDSEIEVILTGDVMLGRTVMTKSLDMGNPTYPFTKVSDTLKKADIVFVNLENPIVSGCPRHFTGFIFCADPRMVEGLVFSGVDVVTLANNHSRNYGQKGVDETKTALGQKGIGTTGLNNLVIREVDGVKFGFLGFEYVDKNPTGEDYSLVKDSNSKVNVLIIGVHWGVEYKDRASSKQKQIAKKLVEEGADVVVGHHPHWVQEVEYINGKPVYYSLGNFIFDQMWSQETREGLAMRLIFDKKGNLKREEKLPIFMSSWARPEFVGR